MATIASIASLLTWAKLFRDESQMLNPVLQLKAFERSHLSDDAFNKLLSSLHTCVARTSTERKGA